MRHCPVKWKKYNIMSTPFQFLSRPWGLLFCLFSACSSTVLADDLQDIAKLLRQGQHVQALERANQFLASKPRDAQGRFLKGLILTEQNKVSDAIDVFTKLSQDYPELPEPYNNLAVLYASQGQYEKARQALEMSIRTHPSYATAYENLGDVYSKLASQAYDRALQLDSSNTTAQGKLSLIRDLITNSSRPPRPAVPPARSVANPTESSKPLVIAAAPKPVPSATEQKPVVSSAESRSAQKIDKPDPTTKTVAGGSEEVIKAVKGWASAWASKDMDAYLSHYAKDFKTPNGEARGEWEKGRRLRIAAPRKIEVSVESPTVVHNGDDNALVTFRQLYRSDNLKASSSKTLVLVKANGKWLIQQERIGKERVGN